MSEFNDYFIPVYKRKELSVTGGDGSYLFTDKGKFLDMFSGLGVNVLGYNNEKVIKAIKEQTDKYLHVSNYFETVQAGKLAKLIVENSFASKVFFSNSGTEAIEAGMKLIKKYGTGKGKKNIITFSKAFHGRTLGSASVTAPDKIRSSIEPLLPNIIVLEFNNIAQIEEYIDENTAGVLIEVVQGQGGVNVADEKFITRLRELATENEAILFVDEIQSGMGRTGKLFAFEHYGIEPDIAAVAKAIGGGLPLGALLANEKFSNVFGYGDHGSTFGGNPVSCAAGFETLSQILESGFLDNVARNGKYLLEELSRIRESNTDKIGRISGIGLMIGIEILKGHEHLIELFEKEGILVNKTSGNILRLLPPLIISEEEIGMFVKTFVTVLEKLN